MSNSLPSTDKNLSLELNYLAFIDILKFAFLLLVRQTNLVKRPIVSVVSQWKYVIHCDVMGTSLTTRESPSLRCPIWNVNNACTWINQPCRFKFESLPVFHNDTLWNCDKYVHNVCVWMWLDLISESMPIPPFWNGWLNPYLTMFLIG